MKNKFAKYLRESCKETSEEESYFKYFLNIAFVRKISSKLSGGFGRHRYAWVNLLTLKEFLYLRTVVWISDTFDKNLGVKNDLTNHLLRVVGFVVIDIFKYFLNMILLERFNQYCNTCFGSCEY